MFRLLWQRRPTLVILGILALVTAPCWGGLVWMIAHRWYTVQHVWTDEDRAHKGEEGLPSDARKMREMLQSLPDITAAENTFPDQDSSYQYVTHRLKNGDWVFGAATGSHSPYPWHKGGMVVLKDSRGRVRVFYGHICHRSWLSGTVEYARADDLDALYAYLTQCGLVEQVLPP